jgi:hypothetical protein
LSKAVVWFVYSHLWVEVRWWHFDRSYDSFLFLAADLRAGSPAILQFVEKAPSSGCCDETTHLAGKLTTVALAGNSQARWNLHLRWHEIRFALAQRSLRRVNLYICLNDRDTRLSFTDLSNSCLLMD